MQITFAEAEFVSKKKQTRRDRLLMDLETLVPWSVLESVIEPYYPKPDGKRGRPTMGLSRMLRMYILQQVMGFSDEGTEDAVYDSAAIQLFMGIDLGRDAVPDATTLLRFRRLLETHGLAQPRARSMRTVELTPCMGHVASFGGSTVKVRLVS